MKLRVIISVLCLFSTQRTFAIGNGDYAEHISRFPVINEPVIPNSNPIVKECFASFQIPGSKPVQLKLMILSVNGAIQSLVSQRADGGERTTYLDSAAVGENTVRSGLAANREIDPETLNQAERLIYHAMVLEADPDVGKVFTTGIDLTKVRSAKYFQVGQTTRFGTTTIVEAKDAKGQILGSFLGGFLIGHCLN